jgi:hypothetical protein
MEQMFEECFRMESRVEALPIWHMFLSEKGNLNDYDQQLEGTQTINLWIVNSEGDLSTN